MYPRFSWNFLGWHGMVPTETALLGLSFLIGTLILMAGVSSWKESWKPVLMAAGTSAFALIGGRLFHVFWERPELLNQPGLIFARWDGMVFYGALALGGGAFFILNRLLFKEADRGRISDLAAIAVAIADGILRLGCFANGCCWGKITGVPWAVRFPFDPYSVMPLQGLPVHPVQLYDSAAGFAIAALLARRYRRDSRSSGQCPRRVPLLALFCIFYGIARFVTEFFRADSIRRENVLLGLSTSQIVSIGVILAASGWLFAGFFRGRRFRTPSAGVPAAARTAVKAAFLTILSLGLSGCLLPGPPSSRLFLSSRTVRPGLESYVSDQNRLSLQESKKRGNAIFLTADSFLARAVFETTRRFYGNSNPPSIDDLAWWQYAPDLTLLYRNIIRITTREARYRTLSDSLREMEQLGQPYDLYLLSHGMPNYLSDGSGYYFSFKEIDALKGKLPHLRLVFMQSCFGRSLARDWLGTGAREVLSFDGFNRNFFWVGFFLRYYHLRDVSDAAIATDSTIEWDLANNLQYFEILRAFGATPAQYVAEAPDPILDLASPN